MCRQKKDKYLESVIDNMAGYYDEQLKVLHEKMLRMQHLDKVIEDLYLQKQQLDEKIKDFRNAELAASNEAKRLEGGISGFLAGLGGKKEEKIASAKQRAAAAKSKLDVMVATLDSISEDAQKFREEIKREQLEGAKEAYRKLYQEKKDAIKASGTEEGRRLLELEQTLTRLEQQKIEMDEAAAAGQEARATIDSMLENLNSADGWATWDVLGGDFITDMIKYDKLDIVEREAKKLQSQLSTFRAELIDVKFTIDYNFAIDGFTRFADWFFDGIFADWHAKKKIDQAKQQAEFFADQIDKVQCRLEEFRTENRNKLYQTRKEVEALVEKVSM